MITPANIGIMIVCLGFAISIFTFYLTQLRPPKISVLVNPDMLIYHTKNGDVTGIYLNVTFINTSNRQGAITNCTLSIWRDGDLTAPLIRWKSVQKRINQKFGHDQEAAPFAVQGNSSINKMMLFSWFSKPPLHFKESDYHLKLHVWTPRKQLIYHKQFQISEVAYNTLEERKVINSPATIEITFDGELKKNMFIKLNND